LNNFRPGFFKCRQNENGGQDRLPSFSLAEVRMNEKEREKIKVKCCVSGRLKLLWGLEQPVQQKYALSAQKSLLRLLFFLENIPSQFQRIFGAVFFPQNVPLW
jgi:hypothetical protein